MSVSKSLKIISNSKFTQLIFDKIDKLKSVPENAVHNRVRAILRRPAEVGEAVDGGVGAVVASRVQESGGSTRLFRPHVVALLSQGPSVALYFIVGRVIFALPLKALESLK